MKAPLRADHVCYDCAVHYLAPYRVPLFLFALAVVVRTLFFPFFPFNHQSLTELGVAYDGYYELAKNVMAGEGFSRDVEPRLPDSVRTPLYPFFIIALFSLFGAYKAVFAAQILLGAGTVVLSWLLAKEFLSRRGALAVGILMAIEPLSAYLTGIMLTETLFTFLFLLSLWLFVRFLLERTLVILFISSLLLGISMLVKPTVQYLPGLILLALAFNHRFRLKTDFAKEAVVVVGVFILCIAPWAYRNYAVFGTTELVVQPVSNLFTYLVPSTIAFETGQTYEEAVADFFVRENVSSIEEINLGNADYYKERALEELKQHPKGLMMSLGMTFWTFFTHDNYAMIVDRYTTTLSYAHPPLTTLLTDPVAAFGFARSLMHRPEALVLLGRIFWVVTSFLSFAGVILFALRRGIPPAFLLVIGTVAYFVITTSVIGLAVNGRFRIPVDPIIFIFAVYVLETVFQKRPNGDKAVAKTDFLSFRNGSR